MVIEWAVGKRLETTTAGRREGAVSATDLLMKVEK